MKSRQYTSLLLHLELLLLVTIISFSAIAAINTLQIPYYQTVNRKTETEIFHIVLTGSSLIDLYIVLLLLTIALFVSFKLVPRRSLLRLVCVLSTLTVLPLEHFVNNTLASLILFGTVLLSALDLLRRLEPGSKVERRNAAILLLIYLTVVVCSVQAIAAVYWIMYPSALIPTLTGLTRYSAEIETQFYNIFSELSPLLLLALLMSPVIAILLNKGKNSHQLLSAPDATSRFFRIVNPVLLAIAVLTSVVATVYPLTSRLNPNLAPLSVDFRNYLAVLSELADKGFSVYLCAPDRILSHAFMYAFFRVSGLSVPAAIMYLPVILGPLLVFVTYLTGRELPRGNMLAGFASYMAATSYIITVGMYAGFYANWLANIVATLFIGLFLRWNRDHTPRAYAPMVATSLILLLTHEYTWSLLMGALLCYLVINAPRYLRTRTFSNGLSILLLLSVNYIADLVRSLVLASESAYQANTNLLGSTISVANLLELNKNLIVTFHQFAAGFLASFPILALSILSFSSRMDSEELHHLLSCMLGLSMFLILLGDTISVQSRVLYVLPFSLMCTLGFSSLTLVFQRSSDDRHLVTWLSMSTLIAVCLSQLNYLLRSMATLASFSA